MYCLFVTYHVATLKLAYDDKWFSSFLVLENCYKQVLLCKFLLTFLIEFHKKILMNIFSNDRFIFAIFFIFPNTCHCLLSLVTIYNTF